MTSPEQDARVTTVEHVLKVVPPYFEALLNGTKTFEVRNNDRGYQTGDVLTLWEYDGDKTCARFPCPSCKPRSVQRLVSYIYSGDEQFHRRPTQQWPLGIVVLGLAPVSAPAAVEGGEPE